MSEPFHVLPWSPTQEMLDAYHAEEAKAHTRAPLNLSAYRAMLCKCPIAAPPANEGLTLPDPDEFYGASAAYTPKLAASIQREAYAAGRLAGMEKAARLCDEVANGWANVHAGVWPVSGMDSPNAQQMSCYAVGADELAKSIRALKERP